MHLAFCATWQLRANQCLKLTQCLMTPTKRQLKPQLHRFQHKTIHIHPQRRAER